MTEKVVKKTKTSELSGLGKLYLIAYNGIQTIGWTYLLLISAIHFLDRGTLDTFWPQIKNTVIIFQNAAVLEILHAAIGLVPSGVFLVLVQVYSRVFVVCGILMSVYGSTVSPGLPLCILAWSVTEIIRYGYYTLNLIGAVPQILLFLRYSTFIILYPIGITGELLCMYHSLEEVAEKNTLSISFPNPWNFIFNYYYFIVAIMSLYIPLFPVLYGHMLAQRKKMLVIKKIN
ncbi:very-long-chain (3R)-3-hydroxyacyl-CoA dehydratase 2 [Plodia interpunctella]|uniref:very-long-chain (3R)-3-hydroxyacyl-CoA dehydratase 2 n=1 Tax=Plodia interpunctella TaxID=58824 RepID=UPI002368E26C|nr:very-long-chain (3R)-3-hydroxyacyl-CoA dehydratase 2 [Plodia interpunctella]